MSGSTTVSGWCFTVSETAHEGLTHPQSMVESYPWIRRIKTLPNDPHPENYKVETNIAVVEMGEHPRILENHGYSVQRIGFDQPYGAKFFCTIQR